MRFETYMSDSIGSFAFNSTNQIPPQITTSLDYTKEDFGKKLVTSKVWQMMVQVCHLKKGDHVKINKYCFTIDQDGAPRPTNVAKQILERNDKKKPRQKKSSPNAKQTSVWSKGTKV